MTGPNLRKFKKGEHVAFKHEYEKDNIMSYFFPVNEIARRKDASGFIVYMVSDSTGTWIDEDLLTSQFQENKSKSAKILYDIRDQRKKFVNNHCESLMLDAIEYIIGKIEILEYEKQRKDIE